MGVINKTTENINTLLDKVEGFPDEGLVGKTPVLEIGLVTTVSAGSPADVNLRLNGVDDKGNPIYLIDFEIPQGKDGTTTDSEGNPISIDWGSVLNKPEWIKSSTKPSYTAEEVGALPSSTQFKTINGESILGEGNIEIQGSTTGSGVGQNYAGYKNAEIFNDYTNNKAAGAHAHAEGRETNATGPRAHAEGYKTSVFAADAHAEGRETWCTGGAGHVEGYLGICLGAYSHTEGCVEKNSWEVETGKKVINTEEEVRSFLENFAVLTKIGEKNYNSLKTSFLENYYWHGSLGVGSHSEGINNIVCDKAGHVEGYNNICGTYIPGHGQDSSNYAPHAEGYKNKISGLIFAPHVGGAYCEIISGNYSFAHGYHLSVKNDFEVAFGRYNTSTIDGKKVIFSYGIGNTEDDRKNAISVLQDGSVIIPLLISDNITKEIQSFKDEFESYKIQIEAKLSNEISSLTKKLQEQDAKIEQLISLIQSGDYAKAFVAGDTLVFNKNVDANIISDTLVITDESITVSDKTLTIK